MKSGLLFGAAVALLFSTGAAEVVPAADTPCPFCPGGVGEGRGAFEIEGGGLHSCADVVSYATTVEEDSDECRVNVMGAGFFCCPDNVVPTGLLPTARGQRVAVVGGVVDGDRQEEDAPAAAVPDDDGERLAKSRVATVDPGRRGPAGDVARAARRRAADLGMDNQLIAAAAAGDEAEVEALIAKGADIDAKDDLEYTALHMASDNGDAAMVTLLLDKGADIEAKDFGGDTALLWASYGGHVAVVELLLDKGANIEAKNEDGYTSLHWASEYGHVAVVELLLAKGADIHAKDKKGLTPRDVAAKSTRDTDAVVDLLDKLAPPVDTTSEGSVMLWSLGGSVAPFVVAALVWSLLG